MNWARPPAQFLYCAQYRTGTVQYPLLCCHFGHLVSALSLLVLARMEGGQWLSGRLGLVKIGRSALLNRISRQSPRYAASFPPTIWFCSKFIRYPQRTLLICAQLSLSSLFIESRGEVLKGC